MTISRVRTSGPNSGTTSISVTYGATPAANNLLLYCIISKTGATIGTPTGYTLVSSGSGGGFVGSIFQKRAVGNESGAVTATITSGTDTIGWIVELASGSGLANVLAALWASDAVDTGNGITETYAAQAVIKDDWISTLGVWRLSTGSAAPAIASRALTINSGGGTLRTLVNVASSTWGVSSLLRHNESNNTFSAAGTPILKWKQNTTTVNLQGLQVMVFVREATFSQGFGIRTN